MLKHRTLLLLSLTALLALASCQQEPNCSLQKHTPSCMKALAKQAQHELDLERKAIQIEQDLQARAVFTYHMARLSPLFLLLGCLAAILVFAGLYKGAERRFTSPQAIEHIMRLQEQELASQTAIALAEAETRKPLPSPPKAPKHLHYAPHIRIGNGSSKSVTPPLDPSQAPEPSQVIDQATTPQALPSALDVLKDSRFLLGYDAMGQAVSSPLASLKSFGVGGASGSGKTSLLALLLAQTILKDNAMLAIIDPHVGNPESLAGKLEPLSFAFAHKPVDIAQGGQVIDYIAKVFEERKATSQRHTHMYLVIDEHLAVMRSKALKDKAQQLTEALSQEGRKYNMYCVLASQKWTAAKAGDTRDTLTAHIICKQRTALARYQTGLSSDELPKDIGHLDTGQFYLVGNDDPQRLALPYLDPKTLEIAAKEVTGNKGTTARTALPTEVQHAFPIPSTLGKQGGSIVEARGKQQGSTNGSTKLDPDKQQILDLFRAGSSVPDIARQLSGKQSGRGYVAASERVQGVLREVLS